MKTGKYNNMTPATVKQSLDTFTPFMRPVDIL